MLSVAVLMTATASAQMRIIPRDRVEAVSNPRLSADSASVVFDTKHIVAEPMTEDDAPKNFRYTFMNVGEEPIEILRLVSTCSCATATCTVKSVAPGESAQITVRYNPKGHPGRFERKVFMYTQPGTNPAAVLKLTVDVSNGSDYATQWPIQMGGIRLRSKEVTFTEGKKAVETLTFINLSGKPLKLECETAFMPDCLTFSSDQVDNGAEGTIRIAYDPAKPGAPSASGSGHPSASGARDTFSLILKGLGLPPSKSTITVILSKAQEL